jgi:hypothetical protein
MTLKLRHKKIKAGKKVNVAHIDSRAMRNFDRAVRKAGDKALSDIAAINSGEVLRLRYGQNPKIAVRRLSIVASQKGLPMPSKPFSVLVPVSYHALGEPNPRKNFERQVWEVRGNRVYPVNGAKDFLTMRKDGNLVPLFPKKK